MTFEPIVKRRPVAALVALVAFAAVVAVAACTPENPQSTFDPGGPVAKLQADLYKFIFWIAVGVFVIVEAAVIVLAIRFRAKRNSAMPPQTHGNTKLELTWTVIPAFILLAIAIPTVKGIFDTHKPPADVREDALQIEAIGHQWWFEFRYPGQEIVTANELHIPTGRPIVVTLHSQDVIHSFWIPKLAGKVDMVPNHANTLWFQADDSGDYYGQCAEFCGISHAKMRFRVVASEPADYEKWVSDQRTAPDPIVADSPEAAGRTLFGGNCSMCHTVDSYKAGAYAAEVATQDVRWATWLANPDPEDDSASRIVSAPNLTNFGTRGFLGAGLVEINRDTLIRWVTDPSSIKDGTRMQAHASVYQPADADYESERPANLSPEQVGNIADYLLSLMPSTSTDKPPVVVDPAVRGQALFQANACSGCHSTGDNTLVGPGLGGVYERAATRVSGVTADDYIRQSLKTPSAFIVPTFNSPSLMTPFLGLSDAEIADLSEYLKTLK